MNVTRIMISALTIATLMTICGNMAWADEPALKINSANQAFVDGKIDEALAQYGTAEQLMPGSPLLAYNKGVALYRKGQLDQARHSFTGALDTDNPELAAKASFNLGNCHYADAVQQPESERGAAIESLQTAIAHYRSALQSNSDDTDARANIELAQKLMRKLQKEEQQQQQEQQQEQQQQEQQQNGDQDSQNQDSKPSDSQDGKSDDKESDDKQSEGSKSDEDQSDENQSDQQSSSQDESQQEESDESKSDKSKSDEPNDQKTQSDNQNSSDSESDESNNEPQEQQNPSGSENEDQPQEPQQQADGQPPQPQPGKEPQEMQPEQKPVQDMQPGSAGEQDQQGDGKQMPGYAVSQQAAQGENIDQEEAMKMLQAIRDRDLKRRMQKLNETRRRHRPVDRDW